MIRIWNRTQGTLLVEAAEVADTSAKRRKGLLDRTGLGKGEGIWIVPCSAIHCFFMKFTIDVIFINKAKKVVKVCPQVKPWRIAASIRAHSVIELPEGTIAATRTRRDDQLEFEKSA